ALAFCPKEEGKEYVNHIDEDSTNNRVSNLEWCTLKENNQHSLHLRLGHQYTVRQILDDRFFREFPSLVDAENVTKVKYSNIWKIC
ncbi:8944_t:CDS:1, partial [Diversispora eburnea]